MPGLSKEHDSNQWIMADLIRKNFSSLFSFPPSTQEEKRSFLGVRKYP